MHGYVPERAEMKSSFSSSGRTLPGAERWANRYAANRADIADILRVRWQAQRWRG